MRGATQRGCLMSILLNWLILEAKLKHFRGDLVIESKQSPLWNKVLDVPRGASTTVAHSMMMRHA
jgi:hypothetical protein